MEIFATWKDIQSTPLRIYSFLACHMALTTAATCLKFMVFVSFAEVCLYPHCAAEGADVIAELLDSRGFIAEGVPLGAKLLLSQHAHFHTTDRIFWVPLRIF